jgi:rubredoxin
MANSELGEKECPACEGTGRIMSDYPYSETCPKCKGKGTLDWIENIVGVVGTYIKPGVYTREVDYSEYITEPGTFERSSINDPWRFVSEEDKRELLGEINGE